MTEFLCKLYQHNLNLHITFREIMAFSLSVNCSISLWANPGSTKLNGRTSADCKRQSPNALNEVIQTTDAIYVEFHDYMTFRDNHVCSVFSENTFSYYTIWKKYWFCSNVILRIKFIYKTFRKQRLTSKCKEQTFALPIYIKICRNFQSIQSTYKFL